MRLRYLAPALAELREALVWYRARKVAVKIVGDRRNESLKIISLEKMP